MTHHWLHCLGLTVVLLGTLSDLASANQGRPPATNLFHHWSLARATLFWMQLNSTDPPHNRGATSGPFDRCRHSPPPPFCPRPTGDLVCDGGHPASPPKTVREGARADGVAGSPVATAPRFETSAVKEYIILTNIPP